MSVSSTDAIRAKNDTKASRAKYACPKLLDNLLKKMKWFSPDKPLLPFWEVLRLVRQDAHNLDEYDTLQRAFQMCLENLPTEFQNYVRNGISHKKVAFTDDVLTDINNQIRRYEDFRLSRLKLQRIVDLRKNRDVRNAISAINEDFGGACALRIVEVDGENVVRIIADSFSKAIHGAKIDRVRKCDYCQHIFWANRIDQKTCNAREGDLRQKQLNRKRNKRKREENKKNGNL